MSSLQKLSRDSYSFSARGTAEKGTYDQPHSNRKPQTLVGEPTTHTPLPPDLCFGFAGHMGLFGRCSGTSNSNAAALRMRSRRDAAVVVAAANVLG